VQFAFAIADDLSTPEDPSGLAVEGKGEYTLAFPAGKEDGVFAEDGGGMAFRDFRLPNDVLVGTELDR